MNTVTSERVSLYYREGSSDKVYQAAIEPAGSQFVVNFAYGRRGATLTTGTKTSSPVDYAAAKKIYGKLVGEKKAKGYTEGATGTPYSHTDKRPSGILPQLLNPVEEAEVELLLRDDNYCAQEKFDGRHLLVRKQDDDLEGINKKGFVVGLPQTVASELRNVPGSFIVLAIRILPSPLNSSIRPLRFASERKTSLNPSPSPPYGRRLACCWMIASNASFEF
jgi:bifunctional non-homologous end joining protein LigD